VSSAIEQGRTDPILAQILDTSETANECEDEQIGRQYTSKGKRNDSKVL
jgi:hypothetical protein